MKSLPVICGILVAVCLSPTAIAQLPQTRISSVFPPGMQQGTTAELVVTGGSDLEELQELLFSHSGIQATARLDGNGQPTGNTFDVSVDPTVPPGIYDVRVRGLFGISNPVILRIDSQTETAETEPNNSLEQAQAVPQGTTVNARSNGGADVDFFKVHVDAGQTIVIRTEAALLQSIMQPLVQLMDSRGHRLAESRRIFAREAMIVHTASEADDLVVRVQDIVYGGSNDYVYRLSVDLRPVIDHVSPLVVSPDGPTPVTIVGRNLPGGEPTGATIDGVPVVARQIMIEPPGRESTVGSSTATIADGTFLWNGIEGNLVRLGMSSVTALEESTDLPEGETDQQVPVPVEITGAFTQRGDQDAFRFTAAKGQAWLIDVGSQRFGTVADPVLIVEQVVTDATGAETFKRLATEDDGKLNPGGGNLPTYSDDPSFRLNVPEDGTYRVRLKDRFADSRGDPRLSYHLSIRTPVPDFSLTAFDAFPSADGKQPATAGAISLRKGGSCELTVYAWRLDGHNDAIRIFADNLPEGITCSPAVIGPGQTSTQIVLSASENSDEITQIITLTGVSGTGETALRRVAHVATLAHDAVNGLPRHGRLSESLVVGVMKDEQPFSIQLGAVESDVSQDRQLLIPVTIQRRTGFDGKVDLSFVGLPANVDAPNLAIDKGSDSAIARIFIKENAPVSSNTVMLYGTSQVPYRRNPWAAERAAARVAEAEAQVVAAQEQVTSAEAAVKESEKTVADLRTEITAIAEQVAAAAAQQKLTREESSRLLKEYEAAIAQLNAAREVLSKGAAPDNKTADETARMVEALKAAAAKVQEVSASVAGLTQKEKELAAAVTKAMELERIRTEEKVVAEKRMVSQQELVVTAQAKLKESMKLMEQRAAEKKSADDALKKADEAAKPKNVNVRAVSNAVAVTISPTPAKLTATVPDGGAVKKGGSLTITVNIARKNEFAGALVVELIVPEGVAGISSDKPEVPADQATATVVVTASADAAAGDIANVVLRATGDVNGRRLSVDVPVAVKVVE